ncbi:hypothetical protein B0T18DRAFT_225105 [Schizothecium vesticola]|uniref:Uncharacterized protein n=1 Tax=Schizothecium vesticola TaxID=314040 RepID=A0AA40EKQ2_9PEZI|nr:hypothetical protein B0T18DRAFT_225105 [Schizothecium vesticola]
MAASPLLLPFCLGLLSPRPLWAAGNGPSDRSNSVPHEPRSLPSSLSGQCTHHFAQFWRGSPGPPWLLPTAQWTTPQLASGQFPKARRIPPLDVALSWGTFLFGTVLGLRSMPPPPSCWRPVKGGQEKANPSETGQCLVLNGPLRVNYPRRKKKVGGRCTNNLASRPSPGFHGIRIQTFFSFHPLLCSQGTGPTSCARRYIRSIPPF